MKRLVLTSLFASFGLTQSMFTKSGACCYPTGCDYVTSGIFECELIGPGIYQGDGSTCTASICDGYVFGACCSPFIIGFYCTTQESAECALGTGAFGGDGTQCTTEGQVANCDNFALPVELTRFSALAEVGRVVLSWQTASETNNAGFEIEQAVESGEFRPIAFIEGAGTTTLQQDYNYTVEGLAPGTFGFRLRQIDFDGTFEYSHEVEVTVEVPGHFVLEPAYPNPFNPMTTVRFAVAVDQLVVASLHDASGRLVREIYRGQTSANETQDLRIEGDGLASGTYSIMVKGETFTASRRITLLR